MKQTKLFQLLHTLNAYEWNRFEKFLHSPYHNEEERLVKLFDVLAPAFRKQNEELLEQKQVWSAVYPNSNLNQLKFARLFSDMLRKLEEFLVADKLKYDKRAQQLNLLAQLTEKRLVKHYPDSSKLARSKLLSSPYRDDEFYLQLFRLESYQNSFLELQNQRTTEKNLLQTLEALDAFYLINKLNYLAAMLHYKNFLAMEGEVKLATEVLSHLEKNHYEHIPAVNIYYKIVLTLIDPQKEEYFQQLRTLLDKNYTLFPKQNARNLFAFAINYCIRKINFGKLDYVNELLTLYKQMLNNGLMMDNEGRLSQFDYKNIVTVSLRAGDAKWTEKFIREYRGHLPKPDRQNAYTFNLARLHFYQRKFDKVLPLLQDVVYNDIFYQLDSKTTLMKTYYELGEYLPLMALKESFRILLRRKKLISEQNRLNYINFLRYTMKLYRADVKDKKKMEELKRQISESANVADKTWLKEKMEEISG